MLLQHYSVNHGDQSSLKRTSTDSCSPDLQNCSGSYIQPTLWTIHFFCGAHWCGFCCWQPEILHWNSTWKEELLCFLSAAAAAAAKSLQSCPTLCDPIDDSPPGSPVPGILQARILEWVAISFSNAWKWKVKVKSLSHVRLLATPWTAAYQAPPSMGFSRQEYWSGVPLPSPLFPL